MYYTPYNLPLMCIRKDSNMVWVCTLLPMYYWKNIHRDTFSQDNKIYNTPHTWFFDTHMHHSLYRNIVLMYSFYTHQTWYYIHTHNIDYKQLHKHLSSPQTKTLLYKLQ